MTGHQARTLELAALPKLLTRKPAAVKLRKTNLAELPLSLVASIDASCESTRKGTGGVL